MKCQIVFTVSFAHRFLFVVSQSLHQILPIPAFPWSAHPTHEFNCVSAQHKLSLSGSQFIVDIVQYKKIHKFDQSIKSSYLPLRNLIIADISCVKHIRTFCNRYDYSLGRTHSDTKHKINTIENSYS